MKPQINPYKAEQQPPTQIERLEALRRKLVVNANFARQALFAYDSSVATPPEAQVIPFERPTVKEITSPETAPTVSEVATQEVPDSLTNVMDMMDRAEAREMDERTRRLVEARRLTQEVHDEIAA